MKYEIRAIEEWEEPITLATFNDSRITAMLFKYFRNDPILEFKDIEVLEIETTLKTLCIEKAKR